MDVIPSGGDGKVKFGHGNPSLPRPGATGETDRMQTNPLVLFSAWIIALSFFPFSLKGGETLKSEVVLELSISEGNPRNTEGDIVPLKDGRLFLVYTRFTGGGSDHDTADLVSRVSSDGGHTWSDRDEMVVANAGGLNVMSVSLLRLQDGRIALFYLEKNSLTDCRPVVRFSTDEAASWSAPVGIIPDSETGYYVLNNDRVIQHSGGRLLAPLALHHRPDWEKPDWNGEVGAYYSDDAGESWKRSGQWKKAHDSGGKRVAAQEPGLIERKDGSLLMYIRTGAGELYRSESRDLGMNWSDPEPMGVASPQSPATIERIPGSDTLVMVWNDHSHLPVAERKARTPLSLALSHDEGKSWSKTFVIEPDPKGWFCYTAMEFTPEALLLAYVAGEQSPGKHLSASRVRRISLTELR
ncbi:MAG: exo-alpha-sialidase [Verrucomicrobiae bacterium]|nr:exo-alpha-sialidase [Verrucomicrobiae bacterium]